MDVGVRHQGFGSRQSGATTPPRDCDRYPAKRRLLGLFGAPPKYWSESNQGFDASDNLDQPHTPGLDYVVEAEFGLCVGHLQSHQDFSTARKVRSIILRSKY
jgi:hypothetical protein